MTLPWRVSATLSWFLVVAYTAILFCSLPYVRPLVSLLRSQHLLSVVVTSVYALVAVGLAGYIARQRPSKRSYVALGLVVALGIGLFFYLPLPEERMHFVEYGALALLVRQALAWHCRARAQFIGVILIGAGLGWLDELVQGLIPSRVYDLRDVAFNAIAVFLAMVADEAIHGRLRTATIVGSGDIAADGEKSCKRQ